MPSARSTIAAAPWYYVPVRARPVRHHRREPACESQLRAPGQKHRHGRRYRAEIAFRDATGADRTCPIAAPVASSTAFARKKVKHILNALLLGLAGDGLLPVTLRGPVSVEAAQAGREYLVAVAVRQQRAGAQYIDVNVDEIDSDESVRVAAMEWLVRLLEPTLAVPLSVDSSSVAVLKAGLLASKAPAGAVSMPAPATPSSGRRADSAPTMARTFTSLAVSRMSASGYPTGG